MAVDLTAYFRRIACLAAVVGIALPGGATALAELTVSAPGWDGVEISRVTLHGADARVQLLVTGLIGDAPGGIGFRDEQLHAGAEFSRPRLSAVCSCSRRQGSCRTAEARELMPVRLITGCS